MSSWSFPLCPTPPNWHVDWPRLLNAYPWLQPLDGVPQDSHYHAEGDVLIHTRMVVEALTSMHAWRRLPETERAVLFAAALMHDIGKASTTQHEPDGHISSRGHARRGATQARQLLWTNEGFGRAQPFAVRESIVALIRHHGLPIWFWDKEDIERAIFSASYQSNLSHVALLAEADARGRICDDQAELLARIDMFREFCTEHGCLQTARPFPSDHSRVRYFRNGQQDPNYHAYDDTWGEVVVMAGLPGAGKNTWIDNAQLETPVISLDAIRAQLGIGPEVPQGAVVRAAKGHAREFLRRKQPFLWNATNLSRQLRDPLLDLILGYGARCRIVYIDAPIEAVLDRNRKRRDSVPEPVILRLMSKLDLPDLTEAHHVYIEICS